MRIDDPSAVARPYAPEDNLEARRALGANAEGPDPREIAFGAEEPVELRELELPLRSRRASTVFVATKAE